MIPNRGEQIARSLEQEGLDVLVCALPKNVLLLSGYWPVVGTSMAVALSSGAVHLVVPDDEKKFASHSRAISIETFEPGSLEKITTAAEAIVDPLSHVLGQFGKANARIGYEQDETSEPSSYAAMHLYGGAVPQIIRRALPFSTAVPADKVLRDLGVRKTSDEIARIETACRIGQEGYVRGAGTIRAGMTELEAAAEISKQFATALGVFPDVQRGEAFVFVMSGKNAAKAHGAFAHSSIKPIEDGDLILVHCNSFADGYSTDITRTFSLGEIDDRRKTLYDAIFAAREAAFAKIAPGVKAAEVDRAARNVLSERGFGPNFKHSTGHGVGFGAISANGLPRLHPKSEDVLEPGMVFNVEPAIYVEDYGGMRHCDMVAMTDTGFRLLTPFQARCEDLILNDSSQVGDCAARATGR